MKLYWETMKRNQLIDLFRIAGAIFIIALNAPYGSLNAEWVDYINLFSRWAVPFYFIASGYFFEAGFTAGGDKAFLDVLKKLVGILLISNFFYFLVVSALALMGKATIPTGFEILHGSFFHLWFLSSLIFGYVMVWYLISVRQTLLLGILSAGLMILAVVSDSYDGLVDYPIATEFPRFLLSIPLLYLGYFAAKRKLIPERFVFPPLIMIVIGIVLQVVEAHFLLDYYALPIAGHQFLIGTFILAAGIFLFAVRSNLKENLISRWGMKYSLLIYIYHPAVMLVQTSAIEYFFPLTYEQIFWFNPLINFVILIIILSIIDKWWNRLFQLLGGNLG